MEKLVTANLNLGVLGGGQLGKMLALAGSVWNVKTAILDEHDDMPAAPICHRFVEGDFRNKEDVLRFGRSVDVLTIEIEQVNIEALETLENEGRKIFPRAAVLRVIQDKLVQNEFIKINGFPKPRFSGYANAAAVLAAIESKELSFPFVQKTRLFGYDGRGVRVIRSESDLRQLLNDPCVVEEMVLIQKELSVVVARNGHGDVVAYDPVEMVFDKQVNLVDYILCPADLSLPIKLQAQEFACRMIKELDMVGVLAVEMFLDLNNKLWINELAPRPHNSGHHTIESCVTSQYEQHLRAIFNLPLGSTAIKTPSIMMNLLGEPNYSGPVRYEGLTECLAVDGVKIHIYGKKETKPFRKMGHVTILDSDLESARKKAVWVRNKLKVVA